MGGDSLGLLYISGGVDGTSTILTKRIHRQGSHRKFPEECHLQIGRNIPEPVVYHRRKPELRQVAEL